MPIMHDTSKLDCDVCAKGNLLKFVEVYASNSEKLSAKGSLDSVKRAYLPANAPAQNISRRWCGNCQSRCCLVCTS